MEVKKMKEWNIYKATRENDERKLTLAYQIGVKALALAGAFLLRESYKNVNQK